MGNVARSLLFEGLEKTKSRSHTDDRLSKLDANKVSGGEKEAKAQNRATANNRCLRGPIDNRNLFRQDAGKTVRNRTEVFHSERCSRLEIKLM